MKNQRGATGIEYVLLAALVAGGAVAGLGAVGGKVSTVLNSIANAQGAGDRAGRQPLVQVIVE